MDATGRPGGLGGRSRPCAGYTFAQGRREDWPSSRWPFADRDQATSSLATPDSPCDRTPWWRCRGLLVVGKGAEMDTDEEREGVDYLERSVEFYELLHDVRGQNRSTGAKPVDWDAAKDWFATLATEVAEEATPDEGNDADEGTNHVPAPKDTLVDRSSYALHGFLWRAPKGSADLLDVLVLTKANKRDGLLTVLDTKTGVTRPLPLKDGEGIAYETHVAFFEDNIIGIIRNGRSAPNVSAIETYLREKFGFWAISVVPVSFGDPAARIADGTGTVVYSVKNQLPPSLADLERQQEENLSQARRAIDIAAFTRREINEVFGTSVHAELRIWTTQDDRRGPKEAIRRYSQELAGLDTSMRPDRVTVTAREGSADDTFDLLKNKITKAVRVRLDPVDAIQDSTKMFAVTSTSARLSQAYDDLRGPIAAASRVATDGPDHDHRPWWRELFGKQTDDGKSG